MHIILADIHYPEHDAKAIKTVYQFIRKNRKEIVSVTLLGDALDCANLSRHTKGKPRLRKHRGYKEDLDGFAQDILEPIERAVPTSCKLVYICGNHEDWIESDLLDEMPELDGIVNIPDVLRLEGRGWQWVPVGGHIERAGFVLLHGDQIGSGIHVSKKMVDSVNENCIMGHVHRYSAFSKAALVTEKKKQLGTTLPCLCTVAPAYAKNQPNAFVVGFGILEEWAYNRANLYVPIIITMTDVEGWVKVGELGLGQLVGRPDPVNATFGEVLDHWLAYGKTKTGEDKDDSTKRTDERNARNYLSHWADRVAKDIEPLEIQQWLDKQSYGIRSKLRSMMSAVYRHGQKWGYIPRGEEHNPMKLVSAPSKSDFEAVELSGTEAAAVIHHISDPLVKVLVILIAVTGMRISEALALTWDAIDWIKGKSASVANGTAKGTALQNPASAANPSK